MNPIPGQRRIMRGTGLLVEVVAVGFSRWIRARCDDVEMVKYGVWNKADKEWAFYEAPLDDFVRQTTLLESGDWKDFQEYLAAREWAYRVSGGRYGAKA
jgi:hypothetical protein